MDVYWWITLGIVTYYTVMIPVVKQGWFVRTWRAENQDNAPACVLWLSSPFIWFILGFAGVIVWGGNQLVPVFEWFEPKGE